MGGRGVVVHVGKSVTMEADLAWSNMVTHTLSALAYASPECPLLLETPAGQGTEMLTTLEQMMSFIETIRNNLKQDDGFDVACFGLCVDTCHVFALGYDPATYLRSIDARYPGLVKLIHLNDSETPCGSHVDRHHKMGGGLTALTATSVRALANPTTDTSHSAINGHIGLSSLADVIEEAMTRGIPMVIE